MCNKESAMIWNKCIEANNKLYEENKKLHNRNSFFTLVKDIETEVICSNNKQTVAKRVIDAYKAISKARKAGRVDEKYPYKIKKYFPTEWDYNYLFCDYNKNEISLTVSRFTDANGVARNGKQIRLKFKTSIPQNIKTLKLIYEGGRYYACISYLTDVEEKQPSFSNVAAIDLGEIHAITSVTDQQDQLIITGRKIRSIKQFRNKKQAELRSKMDKCKKYSRQWKKYNRAWQYIKSKTRRQLDYHIHKLTRMYTDWAKEKGISLVYCGDVTGIDVGSNKGTNVNQKLSQWEYGLIMELLDYKLRLEGIRFIKVNESYSSQICPSCGFKNKPTNRNYCCSNCEEEYHRDIVGAWNILNMNHKLDFVPSRNTKYLRIS
jgi:putative transposase